MLFLEENIDLKLAMLFRFYLNMILPYADYGYDSSIVFILSSKLYS